MINNNVLTILIENVLKENIDEKKLGNCIWALSNLIKNNKSQTTPKLSFFAFAKAILNSNTKKTLQHAILALADVMENDMVSGLLKMNLLERLVVLLDSGLS